MSEPLKILFQDESICAINKPSGYVVHKTRGAGDSPLVLQTLRDQIGQKVYPVHRLDRGTSGSMIFALNPGIAGGLQASLTQGQKKYYALCLGHLDTEGEFNRPLTAENKVKQEACTWYRVIQEFAEYSLLDVEILTGRKHQIRRHLSFEGHHIIGDVNHGKGWLNRRFRESFGFHRLFLHCHRLSLIHPVNGQSLSLESEMPDDLKSLLKELEQGSDG
ncbi:MAG: pseudouridine synthase [Pseudomonadota bacterium]